jgi:hypothetical protein
MVCYWAQGIALAQIGEFSFVLLSRAKSLGLVPRTLYLLLLGTTALSLFFTPFAFEWMTRYVLRTSPPHRGGGGLLSASPPRDHTGCGGCRFYNLQKSYFINFINNSFSIYLFFNVSFFNLRSGFSFFLLFFIKRIL